MDKNDSKNNETHMVYTLTDPRDNTVRYVGMSLNAYKRYGAHLIGNMTEGPAKKAWIDELIDNELLPILTIIERVKDRRTAYAKENYWIEHFTKQGAILLNATCIMKRTPKEERWEKLKEKWLQEKAEREARKEQKG